MLIMFVTNFSFAAVARVKVDHCINSPSVKITSSFCQTEVVTNLVEVTLLLARFKLFLNDATGTP